MSPATTGGAVFRTTDRGDSWVTLSGDLSRNVDRFTLPLMGRVWSIDASWDLMAMSEYGTITSLSESPVKEGLLYAGTDDGLIHVSADGGENWSKTDSFPGVPNQSLVEDIIASRHDENVAWAVFDNHKRGDHKPYVLRTDDQGVALDVLCPAFRPLDDYLVTLPALPPQRLLALDGITNPQNVGMIVRSASSYGTWHGSSRTWRKGKRFAASL